MHRRRHVAPRVCHNPAGIMIVLLVTPRNVNCGNSGKSLQDFWCHSFWNRSPDQCVNEKLYWHVMYTCTFRSTLYCTVAQGSRDSGSRARVHPNLHAAITLRGTWDRDRDVDSSLDPSLALLDLTRAAPHAGLRGRETILVDLLVIGPRTLCCPSSWWLTARGRNALELSAVCRHGKCPHSKNGPHWTNQRHDHCRRKDLLQSYMESVRIPLISTCFIHVPSCCMLGLAFAAAQVF